MQTALLILAVQTLLGALDNILHHELTERLPSRPSARVELRLHAAREAIYGVLFLIFAWTEPSGVFAAVVLALLLVEVAITVADFIEEDRTRRLPAFERVLHTILAVLYGAFLAIAGPWLGLQTLEPNEITFVAHGLLSWFFTAAAIGVAAFAVRNALAVRTLARWRPSTSVQLQPSGRSVLITGATGFIGCALVARLLSRGDRVIVLSRDQRHARAVLGDAIHVVETIESLPLETQIGAVVNLAGAPVLGLPWLAHRRCEILGSRVALTEALVTHLARLQRKPRVLVNASAIGFYGDAGDEVLDESKPAGTGFGALLCEAWEGAAFRAREWGIRTVCLRIGLVLDRSGGPLPMMALPARFGLGAILGPGRQWMSWITRDDLVRMIMTAIDDERWSGPVNAVAPEPTHHANFQKALARTLGRPLLLKVPAILLRITMGEMSSVFLFSQRVAPRRAQDLGFTFDVLWAADALALQLGPPPAPLPPMMAETALISPPRETPSVAANDADVNEPQTVRLATARRAGAKSQR